MVDINGERLLASLQELGRIGALAGGGVCRLALTDEDKLGRDWVVARMRELGMEVSIDGIGNVVGTRAGTRGRPAGDDRLAHRHRAHRRPLRRQLRRAGRAGGGADAAAMPASRTRAAAGRRLLHQRGRRALRARHDGQPGVPGGLPLEDALRRRGIDGATVGDELRRIGYRGTRAGRRGRAWTATSSCTSSRARCSTCEGVAIGAVEGVQGISWTKFDAAPACPTTPAPRRCACATTPGYVAARDRLLRARPGARAGRQPGGHGRRDELAAQPGQRDRRTGPIFTVDLRNTDEALLPQAEQRLWAFADEAARDEGVEHRRRAAGALRAGGLRSGVVDLVERTARDLGLSVRRLPSGAGHDAQMLARICPAAMIFVPSVGGLSHNVREHTEPDDLVAGAQRAAAACCSSSPAKLSGS